EPGVAEPVGADHVEGRLAQRLARGEGQAHPRGAAGQPLVVPPPAVRLPPVDPQRLEDAVAGEQPVVERRDAGLVLADEGAVDPHDEPTGTARGFGGVGGRGHAGTPIPARSGAPASASSRAALSSVSRHSAAGSESTVMPPPTPRCVCPPTISKVRMATLSSSAERAGSNHPTAPQ